MKKSNKKSNKMVGLITLIAILPIMAFAYVNKDSTKDKSTKTTSFFETRKMQNNNNDDNKKLAERSIFMQD
jgi:hypothetical protein